MVVVNTVSLPNFLFVVLVLLVFLKILFASVENASSFLKAKEHYFPWLSNKCNNNLYKTFKNSKLNNFEFKFNNLIQLNVLVFINGSQKILIYFSFYILEMEVKLCPNDRLL